MSDQLYHWLSACGDLPLFEELLAKLATGEPFEKVVTGFLKPLQRTQRNFYKWMGLHPEAKGLISAKLTQAGSGIGFLAFSVNLKREKRGRRPK